MAELRKDFPHESGNNKLLMLQNVYRLNQQDTELCRLAAEALERKEFAGNLHQMVSVLYMLVKNKYPAGSYVDSVVEVLCDEPKLDYQLACRSLLCLFAMNHYSEPGLKSLTATIAKNFKQLNEVDLAGTLRALAHFNYSDEELIEPLVKKTMMLSNELSLGALASIVDSIATLEMANPQLMSIARELILSQADMKRASLQDGSLQDLSPKQCAQIMRAFVTAGRTNEVELFEAVQA